MGRSVHWGITRDAWTPGFKNGTKMAQKRGEKRGLPPFGAQSGQILGGGGFIRRHLCSRINHPQPPPPSSVSLFSKEKYDAASVFVPFYSAASKICMIHIIFSENLDNCQN